MSDGLGVVTTFALRGIVVIELHSNFVNSVALDQYCNLFGGT